MATISPREYAKLVLRAAQLDSLIERLNQAFGADYHTSALAEKSADNAAAALAEAITRLGEGDDHASRLMNVSYFYAFLAENILNSEVTENMVGEGRQFNLLDSPEEQLNCTRLVLARLENKLTALEETIQASLEPEEEEEEEEEEN